MSYQCFENWASGSFAVQVVRQVGKNVKNSVNNYCDLN